MVLTDTWDTGTLFKKALSWVKKGRLSGITRKLSTVPNRAAAEIHPHRRAPRAQESV